MDVTSNYTTHKRLNETRLQDIVSSVRQASPFGELNAQADASVGTHFLENLTHSAKNCITAGALITTCVSLPPTALLFTMNTHYAQSNALEFSQKLNSLFLVSDSMKQDAKTDTQGIFARNQVTVADFTTYLRLHVNLTFASKLAKRIETLFEDSLDEDETSQEPLSTESLNSFISFLNKEKNLLEPTLVLSATGNLRAQWHKSRTKHFVAEFLSNGQVKYVVFSKNAEMPSKTDRFSGLTSIGVLMKIVEPLGVHSWATC